jgi:hypothetical protein
MLKIKIPDQPKEQLWDEVNECFTYIDGIKGCELTLEHSLLSVSKWESIWCKPFLLEKNKTVEEMLSYIECMTITPTNVEHEVYQRIPQSEFSRINEYIKSPASATTFGGGPGSGSGRGDIVTSELIYYWMTACNIPFECQKWHLNRLLTLIRICQIKNDPKGQKKVNVAQVRRDYDKLNDLRRAKMHTKG